MVPIILFGKNHGDSVGTAGDSSQRSNMPPVFYQDEIGLCPVCGAVYIRIAVWIDIDQDIILYMYLHPSGQLYGPSLCPNILGVPITRPLAVDLR